MILSFGCRKLFPQIEFFISRNPISTWRKTPNSTAVTVSNKHYAIDAGVNAVQHFLDRRGVAGSVRSRGAMTNYIIDWKLREDRPSVSIDDSF